jgi:hypothetical protein
MENAQLDTDLEATEASDRQHEREFRLAVDIIPGLAWTALPDGSCDFLNQVEKKTLELIAGGASLAQVLENMCRTMDAGAPNTITTVLLMDPDGKRLWPVAGPRIPSGPTRHHFAADRPMRRFVQHSGIPDVVPMDISMVSSGRTGELSEAWQGQLDSRFGPRSMEVRP